jgi:hypothetical protein
VAFQKESDPLAMREEEEALKKAPTGLPLPTITLRTFQEQFNSFGFEKFAHFRKEDFSPYFFFTPPPSTGLYSVSHSEPSSFGVTPTT